MSSNRRRIWIRRAIAALLACALIGGAGAGVFWWKFLSPGQQEFADAERFKYGSLGGELVAGIPYSIFMVLPRVFPDLVEKYATAGYGPAKKGYGGYNAFGLAWEEGQRLPIGLSIKKLGFERVTVNCALCHTTAWRLDESQPRHFAIGGPGHTVDIQGLLRFLIAASHDRRFTAARLMPEIALHFPLDWLDWKIGSFILIPKTRLALQLLEHELGWMNDKPAWGPGRDDAFNLPKFILTQSPWDSSVGNTDFPGLWRLGERDGQLIHSGGEAHSAYAVTATSALGTGSLPDGGFEERNNWIVDFLRRLEPPKFPLPVDSAKAAAGGAIFAARCAACHAPGGARTGTAIPLDEIGTDPEHVKTWTQQDADRMNRLTSLIGVKGAELQAAQGYVARPLTGVWLLGPYLHNGSVPTVADLLRPSAERPRVIYRGYDVIDPVGLGFVATGAKAEAAGFRFDTGLKGNGNGGHVYGTDLGEQDRAVLIEFLKTL